MDDSERNDALKKLWGSKRGEIEEHIVNGLVEQGTSEVHARSLARKCSTQVLRNGMAFGGMAAVGATIFFKDPVRGAIAGGSLAVIAALGTLITTDACASVTPINIRHIVNQLEKIDNQ